jgi:hypothetical protein
MLYFLNISSPARKAMPSMKTITIKQQIAPMIQYFSIIYARKLAAIVENTIRKTMNKITNGTPTITFPVWHA